MSDGAGGELVIKPIDQVPSNLLSSNNLLLGSYQPQLKIMMRWLPDGSFLSVSAINGDSIEPLEGWLARSYRDQLSQFPAMIDAIDSAMAGNTHTVTARLGDSLVDILLAPDRDGSGRMAAVIGIITDASDRIAALRAVKLIEILGDLRQVLSRASSEEEYLESSCSILASIYPATWIGIDRGDDKKILRVHAGNSVETSGFKLLNLSWDERCDRGRHAAGEAIRLSKIQTDSDLAFCRDAKSYKGWADRWRHIAAVPLIDHGIALGVLVVHSDDKLIIDADVLNLWDEIATEISGGIAILRKREQENRARIHGEGLGEQYRQVLANMFDVVVVHRNGKVLDINSAGVSMFRAEHEDDVIGSNLLTLVVASDRKLAIESILQPNVQNLVELRLQAITGEVVEVEGLTYETKYNGSPAFQTVFRDITDRKRVNSDLTRLVTNMEYAQQIAMMGNIDVDVVTSTSQWSKSALSIIGFDHSDHNVSFIDAMRDVLGVLDFDALSKMYWGMVSSGKTASQEVTVRTPADMKVRHVLVNGRPQLDSRSHVTKLLFVLQDVTAHARHTERLQNECSKLNAVVEVSEVGYVEVFTGQDDFQRQGLVTFTAAANELLTGISTAPAPLSFENFLKYFSPEDQLLLERWLCQSENDLPAEGLQQEFKIVLRDQTRWIHMHATKSEDRWLLVLKNITNERALKTEKEVLRRSVALTKSVAHMVEWCYDLEEDQVVWGDDAEEFLGHALPVKFLTYPMFLNTVREQDRPLIQEGVNNSRRNGVPGEMVYVQHFHKRPPYRLYGRWIPEMNENGKVTKLHGVSIDVTRMKVPPLGDDDSRIHRETGLPKIESLQERLQYLARTRSDIHQYSLIAVRIYNYREAKSVVPNRLAFYDMQVRFDRELQRLLPGMDSFGRFEPGTFLVIRSQPTNDNDSRLITATIESIIADTLQSVNATTSAPVAVEVLSTGVEGSLTDDVSLALQRVRNWAMNTRN
jgi:PAS domain S-box-containing protein